MTAADRSQPRGRLRRRAQDAQPAPNVAPPGLPGGQYRPLSDEQLERIVEAALTVLEETGIEVMPSPCRDVWQRAGARIDTDRNRVFVPRQLVQAGLDAAACE